MFDATPDAAIVRLHSGDPTVYGAIARADRLVPSPTSATSRSCPASRRWPPRPPPAGRELTVPGVAQSVVLTRLAARTAASMPDRRDGRRVRGAGRDDGGVPVGRPTRRAAGRAARRSAPAYDPDTPAVIAHRVSWPDERVVDTTVGTLATTCGSSAPTTTVLVLVGEALRPLPAAPSGRDRCGRPSRSHVYDRDYAHSPRRRGGPGEHGPPAIVGRRPGRRERVRARAARAPSPAPRSSMGSQRQPGTSRRSARLAEAAERIPLSGPLDRSSTGSPSDCEPAVACVLASGDPGFFGIVRSLGGALRLRTPRRPPGAVVGVAGVRPARCGLGRRRRRVGPRPEPRCRGGDDPARAARPCAVAVLTAPDTHRSAVGNALVGPAAVAARDRRGRQPPRRARRGRSTHRPRRAGRRCVRPDVGRGRAAAHLRTHDRPRRR